MKKIKNNITLLNIVSNLLLQVVTIISGFVIPKIILSTFGSEVNGLVSSLNQFLNYISLFEGGLSGVILANLYKPLFNKDDEKISSVLKTTYSFYHKLALFFVGYTLILGIVYPIVTHTSFSYMYIFSLTIILSVTLFVQYNYSLTYRLLLQADKKIYIVSFTQIVLTILNVVLFVIISKIYPSIHVLKLASAVVFLLQPIVFNHFVNKYHNINKKIKSDSNLLKERWNGFAINIAYFIHYNTDVTILTIFTTLKTVSVYSVYSLVTAGLRRLIQAASSAVVPSIGHLYAKGNNEELNDKFELYEYIIFVISFFLFTVGGLLITPFVLIYTRGVTDVNYNQPIFGLLLILSELFYCIRDPYVNLAYSANKFTDIKIPAYIEACLNIILSLILVPTLGLIGVVIGTSVAMLYRTLFHVFYLKKHIINRNPKIFVYKFTIFSLFTMIGVFICYSLFPIVNYTIVSFLIYGIVYSCIISFLYIILSLIFYREDFRRCIKLFKN